MKKCNKCGHEFPKTKEYYGIENGNLDGLKGQCKDCISSYRREYREKNREAINEQCRIDWHKNNERLRYAEKSKLYRESHKEVLREKQKIRSKENSKILAVKSLKYYREHKEKMGNTARLWQISNMDAVRVAINRSRSRKKKLSSTLTTKQWKDAKEYFNNECAYCGKILPLAQEHFIPISMGGEHTHNNIIPSCKSCNSYKYNRDFFNWYPTFKHYSKQREVKITKYLGYENNVQQLSLMC